MKYTSRADLLIAAGESIKMQEKAGIEPVGKHDGCGPFTLSSYKFDSLEWEFPLAVVEGKAVFVGDVLYDERFIGNERFVVNDTHRNTFLPKVFSWNPPKPKTVMVELLREDAERLLNCEYKVPVAIERAYSAIRKALEK